MARSPLNSYDKQVRNSIATNLKKLLESSGLTQVELAERVNIPASTLSGYFAERSTPTPGNIQKIADYFNVNKGDIDPRYNYEILQSSNKINFVRESTPRYNLEHEYKYFPVSVSAGSLENIDGQLDYTPMVLPNEMLGKYAGNKNIIILKVNGESMNNIIPNGSYIVVDTSKKHASDIKDRDIVVIAENGLYTVKRYINDPSNERFIFKPDSSDDTYLPIEISYSRASEIELIGRVIKYIVNLY
jgi:hypothetical phagelike protein